MTGETPKSKYRHHRHSKILRTLSMIKEKEQQMIGIGRHDEAAGLKIAADIIQIEFKITDQELEGR